MKKFRFRLETVRRIRQLAFEQAQQRLAECRQQLLAAERQLGGLQQRHRQQVADFAAAQNGGMAAGEFARWRQCISLTEGHIDRQEGRVAVCRRELAAAEEQFNRAALNKQVIDKLRDRHWQRYWQEYLADEQKTLDEMGQKRGGAG
ncbi:MAG: flagellar FliJ family protein [Negativicutes bacterium]|nr:flagellar FliJ family protein [Negativicutes bacterium]